MNTIILVGAGRMGGAMLRGWMAALGQNTRIIALDPHTSPYLEDISRNSDDAPSFVHVSDAAELPKNVQATAIVLATKPQMVSDALRVLSAHITPDTLIVSVAAGVTVATIKSSLATKQPVVRTMPNIGATIGLSASAAYPSDDVTPKQKDLTERLYHAVGSLTWLECENDLHTVTAISGSGPAYFFAICEAMIASAVRQGLPEKAARDLILGTIGGAAGLLRETPEPAKLRETVTSPNGTTAAGLEILTSDNALNSLIDQTISAARSRSEELSKGR